MSAFDEIFGPGGRIASAHPNYEYRPGQITMAEAVAGVFERSGVAIIEAGTGTGKTLAYLIPALAAGRRVIVSTATKSLQEQLFFKDVPLLETLFPGRVRAAYMKGRSNYVCLHRLANASDSPILTGLDDVDHFDTVREWVQTTETGDRAELAELPEFLPFWHGIDARSETCLGQRCPEFEACFITKMRQRAEESDIVIVNHHLFFADLSLRQDDYGQVIPDYTTVVFDESHELEQIAASHFGSVVSSFRFDDLVSDLQRLQIVDADAVKDITQTAARLIQRSDRFWMAFAASLGRARGDDDAEHRVELSSSLFVAWGAGGEPEATKLGEHYLAVRDTLMHLSAALEQVVDPPPEAMSLARRADQLRFDLDFVVAADNPNFVYWCERRGRGTFLNATPIDVSEFLADRLFDRVESAVLTSATLATGGSFDYIRSRLGIHEASEVVVESHFDYENQALLYLPDGMPDPRDPGFLDRACDEIVGILECTKGRAFVLFTSIQQMRDAYERVSRRIDFPSFVQGEGSKAGIIERFRSTEGAVLFATSSFWQGIDVQGEALSCVIIVKLPFAVPSDPVVSARGRAIELRGGNAFFDYQVPEAVITLKQGAGRLIRSRSDVGVLSVLDPRLRTKGYGRVFLQCLPPCPVTTRLDDLRRIFAPRED
ncbi:MAG TPA: helicase C-terminal domain-containing protein [Blastocatellia bacterium]|nr:helicase C-terminal domain-containing protein [Blastocatellia bacterium]